MTKVFEVLKVPNLVNIERINSKFKVQRSKFKVKILMLSHKKSDMIDR